MNTIQITKFSVDLYGTHRALPDDHPHVEIIRALWEAANAFERADAQIDSYLAGIQENVSLGREQGTENMLAFAMLGRELDKWMAQRQQAKSQFYDLAGSLGLAVGEAGR